MPLPRAMFLPNGETRIDFGCPKLYRGIAFIKEKRCLRFVDGWTVTTWNNCKLTDSYEDWKMDCLPVHGDIIRFDEQMQKRLLKYKLLRPKSAQDKDSSVRRNLENLLVFLPTPSMDYNQMLSS